MHTSAGNKPLIVLGFAVCALTFGLSACAEEQSQAAPISTSNSSSVNNSSVQIKANVWADNWYALYHGDTLIKEDSVAFKTERSFNAETFTFDAQLPITLSMIVKDYYEDDSGLEYIGRRQRPGDGGLRAEFFDARQQKLIAVSDDKWRCKVIHKAPLNRSCQQDENPINTCESDISEEPKGWKAENFDDSSWPAAVIHSERDIRPHGGYDDVSWLAESQLIWSADLELDNVLLCRFTIPKQ